METFIEEDTRDIVYRTMTPQSPSKQASWDLTQFSQLPSAAPSHFPESHWWSETSSLSKVILILGKARSRQAPNLSIVSHLGDLMVRQKTSAQDVMREQAPCCDNSVTHQKPSESFQWFSWRNVQAWHKIWGRFIALLTQSVWMWRPHSTYAHSTVSTAPTDLFSEVVNIHTGSFQSTLLGCQVTSISHKPLSLY